MFKMVSCSEQQFVKIGSWFFVKPIGSWSQEVLVLRLFGISLAYMQLNMIGEVSDPDFFYCRRFLKWFV